MKPLVERRAEMLDTVTRVKKGGFFQDPGLAKMRECAETAIKAQELLNQLDSSTKEYQDAFDAERRAHVGFYNVKNNEWNGVDELVQAKKILKALYKTAVIIKVLG